MTRYAAQRGPALENTYDAIREREPFNAGNLVGQAYFSTVGWLGMSLWKSAQQAQYVVYSYETPIAWYTHGVGWTVPKVKYSATTARHQSVVRWAIREEA